jgi:pimeloyl-ACP methyl ester carboxylesterase
MIPARHASASLTANPSARFVLLDGAGHLPHLTRAEFVADRLNSFITPRRLPRQWQPTPVSSS